MASLGWEKTDICALEKLTQRFEIIICVFDGQKTYFDQAAQIAWIEVT